MLAFKQGIPERTIQRCGKVPTWPQEELDDRRADFLPHSWLSARWHVLSYVLTDSPKSRLDSRAYLRNSMSVNIARTWHAALFGIFLLAATIPAIAQHQVYPAPEQAAADLTGALKVAAAQHRRVLLDFGGDWCTDCLVLDSYFHDSSNKPILDASFVLVHINVGHLDQNLKIAERYQVPLNKGVPALAVLSARGKLLYSQRAGEFEAMRHMESGAVTQFLLQWKPAGPAQK